MILELARFDKYQTWDENLASTPKGHLYCLNDKVVQTYLVTTKQYLSGVTCQCWHYRFARQMETCTITLKSDFSLFIRLIPGNTTGSRFVPISLLNTVLWAGAIRNFRRAGSFFHRKVKASTAKQVYFGYVQNISQPSWPIATQFP